MHVFSLVNEDHRINSNYSIQTFDSTSKHQPQADVTLNDCSGVRASQIQLGEVDQKLLVQQVLQEDAGQAVFNPLQLLLRAAGDPEVATLVGEVFQTEFVEALAKLLKPPHALARATAIASYVVGLATMKHGLNAATLQGRLAAKVAPWVATAIQHCVDDLELP